VNKLKGKLQKIIDFNWNIQTLLLPDKNIPFLIKKEKK